MSLEVQLIKIYEEVKKFFYQNKENNNQKSKHWKRYDFRSFNPENLKNFRLNGKLSDGLDDKDEKFSFKIFSELVDKITESYLLDNLPKKNIGNCDNFIKYKGVFVDYNKLIQIYWFWIIERQVLKTNKISNVCEIGGGFGSFSELFLKNYNIKLFSIDLPEANLMTTYYLKKNFPEKKFFLFDKYQLKNFISLEDFKNHDIFILPPNCNLDINIKFDFFINTRSMMEMNFDIIRKYFNFIHKYSHRDTFFLNINRYEKDSVGHSIRISEYPYDNNWKVLLSEPSFNQDWIHFLLTKRCFNKIENNISNELLKIKQHGSKYYGKYIDYTPKFIILKKFFRKTLIIFIGIKNLNKLSKILIDIGYRLKDIK